MTTKTAILVRAQLETNKGTECAACRDGNTRTRPSCRVKHRDLREISVTLVVLRYSQNGWLCLSLG